jgi:hypothetical protein
MMSTVLAPGPPIVLSVCFFLYMILNRSLSTSVFPDGCNLSFATLIFKNGQGNNVANY